MQQSMSMRLPHLCNRELEWARQLAADGMKPERELELILQGGKLNNRQLVALATAETSGSRAASRE